MDTYTHGHAEPVLQSHRWRTAENSAAYLLPFLRPGLDLLDVGCGPGTITVDLAALVAPGRAVGLDLASQPLAEARAAAERAGADVTFQVGDVYALTAPENCFDVVHAHQVLQHLTDPVAALREMARVCRPAEREWWGTSWAGRATASSFAEQAVAYGLATTAEFDEVAAAWLRWAAADDGWLGMLHGELLIRV